MNDAKAILMFLFTLLSPALAEDMLSDQSKSIRDTIHTKQLGGASSPLLLT